MAPAATTLAEIAAHLDDAAQPVSARMRAVFGLRAAGSPPAVAALRRALRADPSALVRHEAAYVLGQLRAPDALPALQRALRDPREDVMVRHEAAEAMGAIAHPKALPLLRRFADDPDAAQEIRETCALALRNIQSCAAAGGGGGAAAGAAAGGGGDDARPAYTSVDPAPPTEGMRVPALRDALCDRRKPLFERYRAMFALRDAGGEHAVDALCAAMRAETDSALFRHEVAFVLGQMQHPAAVPTLAAFLQDKREHEMVRHEAAEALGSCGGDHAERILRQFRNDDRPVVRESVEVALDISEYVAGDELHYADTLAKPEAAGS